MPSAAGATTTDSARPWPEAFDGFDLEVNGPTGWLLVGRGQHLARGRVSQYKGHGLGMPSRAAILIL